MFSKKIALVTTIENNVDNKNTKMLGIQRKYFDEALKCYESWNKFHPEIQKYAICPTKATLSRKEKKQLEKLNVIYIEEYLSETETFENGFINVALSMFYIEEIIEEDIIIHTDLDMTLLKKLPEKLFEDISKDTIICGKYDTLSRKNQRVDFDTGFTIHLRESRFYRYYWKTIKRLIDKEILLPNSVLYYDIEEYAMELLSKEHIFNILSIEKYQLGEGYPSIDSYTDNELNSIYFWHEHLVNSKKEELIKERIKLFKRVKDIKF